MMWPKGSTKRIYDKNHNADICTQDDRVLQHKISYIMGQLHTAIRVYPAQKM